MPRAEVPEGCRQIEFPDGSVSKLARDGAGMVEISDRQAAMLRRRETDIKIVGARIGVSDRGPWVDCAVCPRTFLRTLADPDQSRCARCREAAPTLQHGYADPAPDDRLAAGA